MGLHLYPCGLGILHQFSVVCETGFSGSSSIYRSNDDDFSSLERRTKRKVCLKILTFAYTT
jgi:hypothetical protein